MEYPEEAWRPVKNFEGFYEVSTLANIRHVKRPERLLRKHRQSSGYEMISFSRPGGIQKFELVHRVVAFAFLPIIEGKSFVNHLNGVKTDNYMTNLEWCTRGENNLHAVKMGLRKVTNYPATHLYKAVIATKPTGERYEFSSVTEAATKTGISRANVSQALTGGSPTRRAGGYDWRYSSEKLTPCKKCHAGFKPERRSQRFCSTKCSAQFRILSLLVA